MEQDVLKSLLLYAPRKGVFYWIVPPPGHAELLGEEAGTPTDNRGGKAYHNIQIEGVKYRRSRLAFLYMEGRWPSDVIDHINGDSLDDRWLNLRDATVTQNAWNHKGRSKGSDLPMGVRLNKSGRFSARICVHGEQIQIGTFNTIADGRCRLPPSPEEILWRVRLISFSARTIGSPSGSAR